MNQLVLDLPREDRCSAEPWTTTLEAFIAARRESGAGARATVVSSMVEGLPEQVRERLLAEGIAPVQGIRECLEAVEAAARIGVAQARSAGIMPLLAVAPSPAGAVRTFDEWAGKRALAELGLPVPDCEMAGPDDAPGPAAGVRRDQGSRAGNRNNAFSTGHRKNHAARASHRGPALVERGPAGRRARVRREAGAGLEGALKRHPADSPPRHC